MLGTLGGGLWQHLKSPHRSVKKWTWLGGFGRQKRTEKTTLSPGGFGGDPGSSERKVTSKTRPRELRKDEG